MAQLKLNPLVCCFGNRFFHDTNINIIVAVQPGGTITLGGGGGGGAPAAKDNKITPE